MSQPIITYSLDWGNNTAKILSGKEYINPSGTKIDCSKVSVTFSSSTYIKKFYATAVKEGRDYGFINDVLVDIEGASPTGVKIHELTSRAANTNFSFEIKVNTHLTAGEGSYRIGLYAQQNDGTWNYEYFFVAAGNQNFELSNHDMLQVPVITT